LGARGENDFKLVQMNLERIWRKEISKKKGKGAGAAGPTRLPSGPAGQRGPLPLPSLPRARRPPCSTRRRPRGGRTPALDAPRPASNPPWSGRRRRLPGHSLHPVSPAPSFSFLLRSNRAAAAAPPRAIAGESSAARRRPHQSLKLDAESTRALAVARVSSCERSTEVRVRRAP
jgi:hypothetical protein